jgi:hypothetical protein
VLGPMDKIFRAGVAEDQRSSPAPGPDQLKRFFWTALDKWVAHEFARPGLMDDGLAAVLEAPVVAIGGEGVVHAVFAVAFEAGEEPVRLPGAVCGSGFAYCAGLSHCPG